MMSVWSASDTYTWGIVNVRTTNDRMKDVSSDCISSKIEYFDQICNSHNFCCLNGKNKTGRPIYFGVFFPLKSKYSSHTL